MPNVHSRAGHESSEINRDLAVNEQIDIKASNLVGLTQQHGVESGFVASPNDFMN
jgi:hypothetical protein